ncbi:MAG: ArsR family transcriptional regulator [Candidatus Bathyarchaeia archaeon]
MLKEIYHPNAYLTRIRNVKLGLKARTRILNTLEGRSLDVRAIMKEAGMRYGVVMHHLKLLEVEGIVERKGNKPRVWGLTGLGQKRLENLG